MRILVDIGHPAHIHYFKNCAYILAKKGYEFLFSVRERDSTIELIESTGLNWVSRGKGGKGFINKLLMLPQIDFSLLKIAKRFNPDLFLSFSSPYAAHVSWIMKKPHIALDDTEHAKLQQWMYRPFTEVILSPSCYNAKPHKNQIFFDSYLELAYLHPNYFTPDRTIIEQLGIKENEKYCVLRFVSWDANHDVGQTSLSYNEKIHLVETLSKKCRVFISSEEELDNRLQRYKLNTHPSDLHNVLSFAALYIGEGGTTASESVVLGIPAIYVNSLELGYLDEEKRYGMLYQLNTVNEIEEQALKILTDNDRQHLFATKREVLLKEKKDLTAFLVWFIENYPKSKKIMHENSTIQL